MGMTIAPARMASLMSMQTIPRLQATSQPVPVSIAALIWGRQILRHHPNRNASIERMGGCVTPGES